jgi:maltose alpha-D-glucosyltransferase/alpha-amylase
MGFHFPLMPRLFMALKKERAEDIVGILDRTPPIPDSCQWAVFLRNHDELTLEMVTPEEREWMWDRYAPHPSMRINLGIRRRLAPLLGNDSRRIELAHSLLLTLSGSPVLYYGDEIGMGDDLSLPDRDGVRTPMQWTDGPHAGFSTAQPFVGVITGEYGPRQVNVADQLARQGSLFRRLQRMIAVRKAHRTFGRGVLTWVDGGHPSVAAYLRHDPGEELLILNNLSSVERTLCLPEACRAPHLDLLDGGTLDTSEPISLPPYSHRWLQRTQ